MNVNQLNNALAGAVGQSEQYTNAAVAEAMAVPSIPMLAPGKKWVGVAAGAYAGQSALGAAFGYQINQHWNVGAGVSMSTSGGSGSAAAKIQAGYTW